MAIQQPARNVPKKGPGENSDPGPDDPEEAMDKDEEAGRLGRHDDGAADRRIRSPKQP